SQVDKHLRIDYLGGECPVQAEGTVDGKPFYFRARGRRWSFALSEDPNNSSPDEETADFYVEEKYGDTPYAAGYMPIEAAESIIRRCAEEYLRSGIRPPCRHRIKTTSAVVRQGVWLYAGEIVCDIRILNYKEDYEIAEQACLAPAHRELDVYYVVEYGSALKRGEYPARSESFESLEEALRNAAEVTGNTVEWKES
ncbi:MAG TPA: hypothetical protein VNO14_07690, partial [Blastocatellia bacterium]|nr:hypothetical protein [Blastocatellia bacterium]